MNTIAYAYALSARILAANDNPKSAKAIPDAHKPGNNVWNKITLFLETADSVQLRYIGLEWRKLLLYVEQVARLVGTVSFDGDMYCIETDLAACFSYCTHTIRPDETRSNDRYFHVYSPRLCTTLHRDKILRCGRTHSRQSHS